MLNDALRSYEASGLIHHHLRLLSNEKPPTVAEFMKMSRYGTKSEDVSLVKTTLIGIFGSHGRMRLSSQTNRTSGWPRRTTAKVETSMCQLWMAQAT
jgi:hypothetical protein